MALQTTHSNWSTGSYVTDLQYFLKRYENAGLAINTAQTNIQPDKDSVGSIAIGYGYDLIKNKAVAIAELTAAGATITNATELQTKLNSLVAPVSDADLAYVAARL